MTSYIKKHRRGIIATILFHGALLCVLLFFVELTPPESKAEAGILVDFGTDETGFGEIEPSANQQNTTEPVPEEMNNGFESESSDPAVKEDHFVSQNFDDAPEVKKTEETNHQTDEEERDAEQKKQQQQEQENKKKYDKQYNDIKNAFSNGSNNSGDNSNSEGKDGYKGNQGQENGSESDNYKGGGYGSKGLKISIKGRKAVYTPSLKNTTSKTGIVVVEIKVNRQGKVISAVPGASGTTETDPRLYKQAKEAALKFRFNTNPDAPYYQVGTITCTFEY